eukprot:symbB.v1.2.031765.t1/scaffold3723.1/size51423/2
MALNEHAVEMPRESTEPAPPSDKPSTLETSAASRLRRPSLHRPPPPEIDVEPPPSVDLLALPERRPSTCSSRASSTSSASQLSPRRRLSSGALASIPDDCDDDAFHLQPPETVEVGGRSNSRNSRGGNLAVPGAMPSSEKHVKIGTVEEVEVGDRGTRRRPSTSESAVQITPTGRRFSKSEAASAPSISIELSERLAKIFMVEEPDAKVVTAPELLTVMQRNKRLTRRGAGDCTKERMEDIIKEMRSIASRLRGESPKRSQQQTVISWRSFVELMSIPDLATQARPEMVQEMFNIHSTLRDERVQQSGYEIFKMRMMRSSFHLTKTRTCREKILMVVNGFASISIMMSLIILGFSMDVEPQWAGWTVMEVIFAFVFVMEVVVKLLLLSPRVYFTGTNYAWNIGDLLLTCVAVADVIISTSASTTGSARMSMVLRGLRLSRVARLIKLVNLPLLAELANMISAMVIGVPWLFWVTILLSGVLYICGIILRSTVSNEARQMATSCRDADSYPFNHSVEEDGCDVASLYGQEYCGTVLKCMFTVFRCIIGDCNSKGGRPLAAIFSEFYGWRFEWFYGLSMVCMIFGMTNIITAMFVDATLSGLKYNDVQRKHAKLHETNYVTRKLNDLVIRVSKTVRDLRDADIEDEPENNSSRGAWSQSFKKKFMRAGSMKMMSDIDKELTLSEQEFTQVLQNSKIRNLLDDLDIELEARPGIFEAFGADAEGHLGVSELVSGLMRLRGDLQKSDIVSAQMSLQTMAEKLNLFQATNLSNQSRLLSILEKLSKQTAGGTTGQPSPLLR